MTDLEHEQRMAADRRGRMTERFRQLFRRPAEVAVRAPGRVDLMGSHTDYNDGFVLTLAIDRDTWAWAAPRPDRAVRIHSLNIQQTIEFSIPTVNDLPGESGQVGTSGQTVGASRAGGPSALGGWGVYAQGVVGEMARRFPDIPGFDALIHGTVPLGGGLSSSASLEVALATVVEALMGLTLDRLDKAKLCQTAENDWVGVNCGILDQYSSVMGRSGHAMLLDCRELVHQYVPLATSLVPVICDTRAQRQLAGSEYGQRRAECERAVECIATRFEGVGSLRDVQPPMLDACRELIEPSSYRRASFVVQENERVQQMARALREDDHRQCRELMQQSFLGARDLYEISVPAMETMYDVATATNGCVGCRQAGAGFGGCMIALVERNAVERFCRVVATSYAERTGTVPEVFSVRAADGASVLPFP